MNARPLPTEQEVDEAARKLLVAYDWQSVNRARLVARVMERLAREAVLQEPYGLERLCEGAAAEQLYEGCALPPATPDAKTRREQAYQDLGNYLFAVGPRQLHPPPPEVKWKTVVEDTLSEIHSTLVRRSDTSTFLGLALTILRRQSATLWKTRQSQIGRELSLDTTDEEKVAGSALIEAADTVNTRDPSERVDPEGDKEVLTIIGQCLHSIEQRIVALGLYLGLKRREILLVFGDLPGQYDNIRRAVEKRLDNCSRIRRLRDPQAPWVPCRVRGCPDPSGGAR